ncbi:MAG: ribosome small subunit-dependent GTPase A [Eubacterium sp.]
MQKGKIIKAISGFYYVDTGNEVVTCRARGKFRNNNLTPLVGDDVEFTVGDNNEASVEKVLERKNELVRPPLANLDNLFIIASVVDPKINTLIIDRLIAIAEYKGIEPILVITKVDLDDNYYEYKSIYENAGFKVIVCDNTTGSGSQEVLELMKGKISAFTGNTGVGKSTLLNNIFPSLNLQTGETSKKLGRGKHTTRHSELFMVEGGYIADTPGFSSLDFEKCESISKDELPYCFREFEEYLGTCKFSTCSHTTDKGCGILQAVEDGKISKTRHDSYVSMYNDVKNIKEWELK